MKITESTLKRIIREEIENVMSEEESGAERAHLILPLWDRYIRRVCVLLAWKGLDIDLKGMECFTGLDRIDVFYRLYDEMIKKYGKEGAKMANDKMPELTDARREGNELYKKVIANLADFDEKELTGHALSKFKMFEKAGCSALYGENYNNLSEKLIKLAARYVVRDCLRWLENGSDEEYSDEMPEKLGKEPETNNSLENGTFSDNSALDELDEILMGDSEEALETLSNVYNVDLKLARLYRKLAKTGGAGESKMKAIHDKLLAQYEEGKKYHDSLPGVGETEEGEEELNEGFFDRFNKKDSEEKLVDDKDSDDNTENEEDYEKHFMESRDYIFDKKISKSEFKEKKKEGNIEVVGECANGIYWIKIDGEGRFFSTITGNLYMKK